MATEIPSLLPTNQPPFISPFVPTAACKSLVSGTWLSLWDSKMCPKGVWSKEGNSLAEGYKYEKKNLCKYSKAKLGHRVVIPKGSKDYDAGKGRGLANDKTSGPLREGSIKSSPST